MLASKKFFYTKTLYTNFLICLLILNFVTGPGLLKYLSEVIQTPKLRSKKWVSTSVPEERWDEPIAKYSSAEYHTNNLLVMMT